MRRTIVGFLAVSVALCVLPFGVNAATTRTWIGAGGDADWFNPDNWEAGDLSVNYPQTGDAVLIDGASVLLSNQTAVLSSFVLTNATLTFTNWTTALTATDVRLLHDAVLTLPPAFTETEMSNRVWVVCHDFTLGSGSEIQADSRGFFRAHGPGKGGNANGGGGAGHGGAGARGWGGNGGLSYGSLSEPTDPGSGGGHFDSAASHGGGAIRIDASGAVIINGTISANGGNRN